jgi:hypothetical protein
MFNVGDLVAFRRWRSDDWHLGMLTGRTVPVFGMYDGFHVRMLLTGSNVNRDYTAYEWLGMELVVARFDLLGVPDA